MLTQPDLLFEDPLKLITTRKNKQFAKNILANGAKPKEISSILIEFFSYKVMLRHLEENANNPEWLEVRAWRKKIGKAYDKAIKNLEKLLNDDSIPQSTRETVIKKDVEMLKEKRGFLTFAIFTTPTKKPIPISVQQMLNFQSKALFEYLKKFNTGTDTSLYDFIAELFKNLYKDTFLREGIKNLDGETLKKNFIDNVDKLRGKYDELEKSIKPFLNN